MGTIRNTNEECFIPEFDGHGQDFGHELVSEADSSARALWTRTRVKRTRLRTQTRAHRTLQTRTGSYRTVRGPRRRIQNGPFISGQFLFWRHMTGHFANSRSKCPLYKTKK